MIFYAKSNQTIDDLKNKIRSFNEDNDETYIYDIVHGNKYSQYVIDDIKSIDVEFENIDVINGFYIPGIEDLEPFEMINDIPVCWCACGGDWQFPIVFCLYIDDNDILRAYIPVEGNVYDHINNKAYGNEIVEEHNYVFNVNALRNDVKNKIIAKSKELEIEDNN